MSGMELVIETLKKGSSQDPHVFKPASEQLKSWEIEAGFFQMLAKITSDFSIEFKVRWLAALCIKNGVERYWRQIMDNALSEKGKSEIRQYLLQNFDEPYPQIASQLSIVISRLARLDFPSCWPELLPTILERTKTDNSLVQERALNTLYQIVSQLASKGLANDRRAFQELSTQVFKYLLHVWSSLTNIMLSTDVRLNNFVSIFERSRLCVKILRKLAAHGFKKPHLHDEVNSFMENTFERLKSLMELRKEHEAMQSMKERIQKYIILLTKTMIDLLEHHPLSFIQFIRPSMELILFYLFTLNGERFLFPRLVIQCFNLMKCIIACPEYRANVLSSALDLPETQSAVAIKKELFTPEICVGVCDKLLSKYFILSKEELELWQRDPEEFWTETGAAESTKYNLGAAIENLFVGLFRENLTVLVPFLLKVVQDTNKLVGVDDIEAICQKDAVYNMISIGAFDLYDVIDFDDWFQKTLIHELNNKHSNYRILRRRVVLLVGQWIPMKFCTPNRQLLYDVIINLLSADEDMVVRMAAACTLKSMITDFEFDLEMFLPYVASFFGLLYELLRDAKECETKLTVLDVISFMIQDIGVEITPHIGPLIQYIPQLWVESLNHNMLRCGILGVLTNLTNGLMCNSEKIHPFLISVTRHSTDVNENAHVYLLENGLILWLALVNNCPSTSIQPLLDLYENMASLLDTGTDDLHFCFEITMSYIVLCPEPFLSRYGQSLITCLDSYMEDFHRQTLINMLLAKTYEIILRVLPWDGAQLLRPVWPTVITLIIDRSDSRYTEIYSMYYVLMSRLVLSAGDVFSSVVTELADKMGTSAELLLEKILSNWSAQISLVSRVENMKLCAMGLAEICSNNWPPVLKEWGNAMTSIAEVVYDITNENDLGDSLVFTNEFISASPDKNDDEHKRRLKAISIRDPVHFNPMREFLAVKLKTFLHNTGSEVVGELFQTLEEDCKKLLRSITAT